MWAGFSYVKNIMIKKGFVMNFAIKAIYKKPEGEWKL